MTKRYKELLDIITKFPFLKNTVSTHIRDVYSNAEFLNYKDFVKNYDCTTDIFNLSSKEPRISRGNGYYGYSYERRRTLIPFTNKEDILLYNLISDSSTSGIYESSYSTLIEICNILIEHLNIDASWLEYKYFDEDWNFENEDDNKKRDSIKAVGYIASEFAFADAFEIYIKSVSKDGKSQFISDILEDSPTVKKIDTLCKFLNNASAKSLAYSVSKRGTAQSFIDAAVSKVYDSYTLEDIALFKNKVKNVANIFTYFNINADREATLLNNHISTSDRDALAKSFTSADDIAELTDNVMDAFDTEEAFDGDKVNQIISNVIVSNRKIRDRDFPETKNKVVHEFLRLLFIADARARDFTGNEKYKVEINKVINKNLDYVLDPYFITALLMKDSVMTDYYTKMVRNTKKFIDCVFTNSARVDKFVSNYITELAKSPSERISTVKSIKPNIISYGCLYYIVKKYAKEYSKKCTGIDADGSVNPTKLLFYALLKHNDDLRLFLEKSGARSNSTYYYSSEGAPKIAQTIFELGYNSDSYGCNRIGIDGKDRTLSMIDRKYHGSFNHIMTYLTGSDTDFDDNEDYSVGVFEGSRYGRNDKKNYVPKKAYEYNRNAIRIILSQLYNKIVEEYGETLTTEQYTELKNFITKNGTTDTITILPDSTFAKYTDDKDNALSKEYASDITDYGCLNYISLPALTVYIAARREDKIFKYELTEDCVIMPEFGFKYYENCRTKELSAKSKNVMEIINTLTDEEYKLLKPMLIDNFGDMFSFARTMQVALFPNMLNMDNKSASYYEREYLYYLVDSYWLTKTPKPATAKAIDYVQDFYINFIYATMLEKNLITKEEVGSVNAAFNQAYTDYDCLVSLR